MAEFKIDTDQYTKDDLAFIIKRMVERQGSDYLFQFATYDLALEKQVEEEIARFDRAEMAREAARAKRKEAEKLAEPWLNSGDRRLPLEVQQKYAQLIKEAKEYEMQSKRGGF